MNITNAIKTLAVAAVAFGVLTVFSGGRALFGGEAERAALGNIVSFVVWFNFLAGFAYIVAGAGLWLNRRWVRWATTALLLTTALVGVAFGVHVMSGGAYEMRTVGALTLRFVFWLVAAVLVKRSSTPEKR